MPSPRRFSSARRDASEHIADEIRRYVERSELRPGDRIGTEAELASEFGVSRPTLREALRLLAGSHLVRASKGPGGGIFVESTPQEGMGRQVSETIAVLLDAERVSLRDLLDTRSFLEVPLAGLAARNADDRLVEDLEEAVAAMIGQPPSSQAFVDADKRMHWLIAEAAGNELMRMFSRWILDVLHPSLVRAIDGAIDGDRIVAQHREIVHAISRRQVRAAERAMRAHIEYLRQIVHMLEQADSARHPS